MEEFYGNKTDHALLLNVPLYGTKQAMNCFYKTLIKRKKRYDKSKADSCLYFMWRECRLLVFVSWVDELMILGEEPDVVQVEKDLEEAFIAQSKDTSMSTWDLILK